MSASISRDEWMKALGDAVAPVDPTAVTIRELCDQFGLGVSAVTRRVNALIKEGKAVRTMKIATLSDGNQRRITAYKLTGKPKK